MIVKLLKQNNYKHDTKNIYVENIGAVSKTTCHVDIYWIKESQIRKTTAKLPRHKTYIFWASILNRWIEIRWLIQSLEVQKSHDTKYMFIFYQELSQKKNNNHDTKCMFIFPYSVGDCLGPTDQKIWNKVTTQNIYVIVFHGQVGVKKVSHTIWHHE